MNLWPYLRYKIWGLLYWKTRCNLQKVRVHLRPSLALWVFSCIKWLLIWKLCPPVKKEAFTTTNFMAGNLLNKYSCIEEQGSSGYKGSLKTVSYQPQDLLITVVEWDSFQYYKSWIWGTANLVLFMEIEYCWNGGFYIHTEKNEKSGKYRRIPKLLVQFEGNRTRILGFPDREGKKVSRILCGY